MKKFVRVISIALVVCMALLCMAACSQESVTYRLEAEHGNITDGSLDSKDLASNGFFVYPSGGFTFEEKLPMVAALTFTADKAKDATIVVCVASANKFGNEFDLADGDYSFSLNGTALGVPASVLDYEGNATTVCPKEDFTEGTGFIYLTYNVKLAEGENVFSYNYVTGNGAFKYDYIDITTTAVVEYEPNMDAIDNWEPMGFPG